MTSSLVYFPFCFVFVDDPRGGPVGSRARKYDALKGNADRRRPNVECVTTSIRFRRLFTKVPDSSG